MALIHVIAVISTLSVVLVADYYGGRWFRGKADTIPQQTAERLHMLVSIGLASILLTGGLMFIDRSSYLLSQPVFWAKMTFVGALLVNGFFIGRISRIAASGPFRSVTPAQKRSVLLSAGVSTIGWIGAVILGMVLGGVFG